MIRFLASDIDHTLYSHQLRKIPERNLSALLQLQQQGVRLILATARIAMGVRTMAEQLKMADYDGLIIASAGAELIHCASGHRTVLSSLSLPLIHQLFQFAAKHQVHLSVQQRDWMITTGYDEALESDRRDVGIDFVVVGSDFFSYVKEPACMAALTGTPQLLDQIEPLARAQLNDLTLTRSSREFLDITPLHVCKAAALRRILQENGLTAEALAAIGDGVNDVEMLQLAGLAAAPCSGSEQARKAADILTCSCEDGAVGELAERILQYNRGQRP